MNDLDLGIRRGEAFGLLGPDGTRREHHGGDRPGNRSRDSGEASVLGAGAATGTRAWRSRVGVVRQDESAPVELTVRAARAVTKG
ncbi:MAG: ABC transporter ATP-binding protein, partial [Kitasatospora sp.]|nr:ABC transporter ATP-binding protein [Kitasatospora sp.]